jgi:hypothetical protein
MKMKIEFSMDNEAFSDDLEGVRGILTDIIYRVCENAETGRSIVDLNGNRIGQWTVED